MTRALAINPESDKPTPDHTTAALRAGLPARLRLVVWNQGGFMEVPGYKEIIIGRVTSTSEVDVDLSVFNAQNLGISRQHLQIMPHGRRLMVKDLNSANGSKLNNKTMTAGYVYDLNHGDQLTLGDMHIQVYFANPTATSQM